MEFRPVGAPPDEVVKEMNISDAMVKSGKLSLSGRQAEIVRASLLAAGGFVQLQMPGSPQPIKGRVVVCQQKNKKFKATGMEVPAAPKCELALGEERKHHGKVDLQRELAAAQKRGVKVTLSASVARRAVWLSLPPPAMTSGVTDVPGSGGAGEEDSILGMASNDAMASMYVTLQLKGMEIDEEDPVGPSAWSTTPVHSDAHALSMEPAAALPPVGEASGACVATDDHATAGGRVSKDMEAHLPPPGVAAGEATEGVLLRDLFLALRIPAGLRDVLQGNVRQVRPDELGACNARAKARAAADLAAHSAGGARMSAELAQTVYYDMTDRACLFWMDMTSTNGSFNPVLLVLYVPGPVLRREHPALARAVRNMQRLLMEAQTLNKIPRGRLKECGGETHMAGYRSVDTHKASVVTMYAHTSRSREARVVIGAFGLCMAMLLRAVWEQLVESASSSVSGTPAILSTGAPWGLVPVGLDYFTHPHLDPDDATHTIVFLAVWKAATGRRCEDFLDDAERAAHASRNLFTFGGVSAYTRTQDSDLLVFDARLVVHGADLRVPLSSSTDEAGTPCGVTVGSGVVSRRSDVAAGRAEARGRLELAAERGSGSLRVTKLRGDGFEEDVRRMAAGAGEELVAVRPAASQKRAVDAGLPPAKVRGRIAPVTGTG